MKSLTQADLEALNALSGDVVRIEVTPTLFTLRLVAVVALSNFKMLASASRTCPGAVFNASTKTLTVPLIPRDELMPDKMWLGFPGEPESKCVDVYRARGNTYQLSDATAADLVCFCQSESFDKVLTVALRLGGGKAKTFKSTTDAFKARKTTRKPQAQSQRFPGQDPSEMDMPMWDPARQEWYEQENEVRSGGQDRWRYGS